MVLSDTDVESPVSADFLKDSLASNHPLLNALELKIKAGEASEQAAQKQGLPNLGIGLDYIMVGDRTDLAPGASAPPDNGKDAIMPMVTVSLPIFRSKYKAAVKEAQLMQESYSFQKAEIVNSLKSEYEMAIYDIRQKTEMISLFEQQKEEAGRSSSIF